MESLVVGRDTEIRKLRALLPRARLVTLHGPPGIGKSAIARAAVEDEADVVFCDVTNARSYEDVCFVLAGALDVSLGGGSDLGHVLADAVPASALVVLDGCEGAADAVARLVSELSKTRVLTTSREVLRAEGEIPIEIEPLAASDAIALFVSAARRVRPSFAEAPEIGELVRLLSCVPLAIVLAAARLAVMDVPALIERVKSTTDALAAKRRGEPERHASLRSAFESSIAGLDDVERRALSTFTLFRNEAPLEAFEHVFHVSEDEPGADVALQSLVEKSLVRALEMQPGVRFSMLAILRRLASDALGEPSDDARDRHAAYFARAAATWDGQSWYGGVPELPRLVAMRDDLLAAHAHAAARGSRDTLAAAIGLFPIFAALGPYQAYVALLDETRDEKIAQTAAPTLAARFYLVRGRGLQFCGRRDDASAAFEKSLQYARKAGARELSARALAYLALARRAQGSLAEARERFEASAALFREHGDAKSEAVVLSGLASIDLGEGDLDAAKRALEAAIDVLIVASEPETAAMMRVDLGIVLQEMGDLEGARAVYDAALATHRAAGNRRHEAITLGYLGTLEDERGRLDVAEVALAESLAIFRPMGDSKYSAVFAACLAAVRAQRGDALGAKEALGDAERFAKGGEGRIVATVALHRLRVEAAAGKRAASIIERRGAAIGLVQQSDDVRFALRMLDRVLVPVETPSAARAKALCVAEDATWLDLPGGTRVNLQRRAVHRRLVERLVRERLASPGTPASMADLVAAGWPGEKLAESSAQNRLHVALAALRADGLRDLLKREPGGYLLDPAVEVRVER
jgi:predicted ATPase